jgi:hypothetical protein
LTKTGIVLEFSEEAQTALDRITRDANTRVKTWLEGNLKNYEYGLKLARVEKLSVTPEMLENPEQFLDRLVKESVKKKK